MALSTSSQALDVELERILATAHEYRRSRDFRLVHQIILGAPRSNRLDADSIARQLAALYTRSLARLAHHLPSLAKPVSELPLTNPLFAWAPWLCTEHQELATAALPQGARIVLCQGMQMDLASPSLFMEAWRQGRPMSPLTIGRHVFFSGPDSEDSGRSPGLLELYPDTEEPSVQAKDAFSDVLAQMVVEQGVEDASDWVAPLDYGNQDCWPLFQSLQTTRAAIRLLHASGFGEWVRAFLDRIVLIAGGARYSGRYSVSGPEAPSIAFIDGRGDLLDLIESIVHEASHQQFYLLELASPLVMQNVLAPSPFRSGLRSMRRVLAGAHAYANSIHVIEACAHAFPPQRLAQRLAQLRRKLAESIQLLSGHESLSPVAQEMVGHIAQLLPASASEYRLCREPANRRSAPPSATSPWLWRIDKRGWYTQLAQGLKNWQPRYLPGSTGEHLRDSLENAALSCAEWLYHPCLKSVLQHPRGMRDEIMLLAWAAVHTGSLQSLEVSVEESIVLWTPNGGVRLEAGIVDARHLASQMAAPSPIGPYSLDGLAAFLDHPQEMPDTSPAFENEVTSLCTLLARLEKDSAELSSWITAVAKVISVPLNSKRISLRSFCRETVPGCLHLEIFADWLSSLELIVHESAHLYLFLEEANHALLVPGDDRLYWSPLRKDPRPLRGILLAYHALSFIAAMLRTFAQQEHTGACERRLKEVVQLADMAGRTLEGAKHAMTAAGKDFVTRTEGVLEHARA